MEWLLLFLQVVIIVLIFTVKFQMRDLRDRVKTVTSHVISLRGHNSKIAARVSSSSTPHVDANARTTKRDTPDIQLLGGRMSTAIHRPKRNYDSDSSDD